MRNEHKRTYTHTYIHRNKIRFYGGHPLKPNMNTNNNKHLWWSAKILAQTQPPPPKGMRRDLCGC